MRYVFDIETDGLLDSVTKIHCIEVYDVDSGEAFGFGPDEIETGLEVLAEADELIGHNILGYDIPAIKKLHPRWDYSGEATDTLLMSRLIWADEKLLKEIDFAKIKRGQSKMPPKKAGTHGLEAWGYRLWDNKGDFGKTTDWKQWSPQMQAYCKQDVKVNAKLYELIQSKNVSKQAKWIEHKFAEIIYRQERYGVRFNVEKAAKLAAELSAKRDALEKELQGIFPATVEEMKTPQYWLIDGTTIEFATVGKALAAGFRRECIVPGPIRKKVTPFNPNSDKQVADRLIEKYGWKPKVFTDGGLPSVTEEVLNSLDYPEAKKLAEYATVCKRLSQLSEGKTAWLKLVGKDGRMHGRVITNGAGTGRCTHKNPNCSQVPATYSPYGKECRELFEAGPGKKLVGCDAKGLELRCEGHYMAPFDGGEFVKLVTEGDPHTANQKAAGLDTRDAAKTFIYAFNYGAGDEKLGHTAGEADPDKAAARGAALRKKFLAEVPAMEKILSQVKTEAGFVNRGGYWKPKKDVKRHTIKGLDGRTLNVRSAHSALNTRLQSAGAILMKVALIKHDEKMRAMGFIPGLDYEYVLNIHDEFQVEVMDEAAELAGKLAVESIKDAGEFFGFKCPLDGDYKVGNNWAETH